MAYVRIGNYPSVVSQAADKAPRRLELRREAQNKFSSDKLFLWTFIICLFSVLFEASLILVSWDKLPPQIPLYYLHPWGETRLAPTIGLWILPALTVSFSILNFTVALAVESGNRFLSHILTVACIVVAVGVFYDAIKIISLII